MRSQGRSAVLISLLVVVATPTLTILAAIAVNGATPDDKWPGPLQWVKDDPWPWLGSFAALSIIVAVAAAHYAKQGDHSERSGFTTIVERGLNILSGRFRDVHIYQSAPPAAPPEPERREIAGLPEYVPETLRDRKDEREALRGLLTDPETVFVALVGDRGMGKTALASGIAQHAPVEIAVRYLAVHGYPGVTADSILESLARSVSDPSSRGVLLQRLNGPSGDLRMKWEDVSAELAGQRVWLILDDAQALSTERADGSVHELLRRIAQHPGRRIKVLFVSDTDVALAGRHTVRITDGLPSEDFTQFLADLTQSGLTGTAGPPAPVLLKATDGRPRSAELLLGAQQVMGPTRTLDLLRAASEPDRFASVLLNGLGAPQKQVITVLAALDHPVAADMVDHLVTDAGAATTLAELATYRVARQWEHLYYLPNGEAARMRAAIPDDTVHRLRSDAAERYERLAEQRRPRRLRDMADGIHAIDLYMACGRNADALRLMLALDTRHLAEWGQTHVLEPWLDRIATELPDLGHQIRIAALHARSYAEQGRLGEAITVLHAADQLNDALRSPANQLALLRQLGAYYFRAGAIDTAAEHYAVIAERAGSRHPKALADAHLGLALCAVENGDFDAATTHFHSAGGGPEDRQRDFRVLLGRAIISLESGDDELTLDQLGDARKVGDDDRGLLIARCDNITARVWLLQDRPDKALPFAEKAFEVASRVGDPSLFGPAGTTLALAQLLAGKPDKAFRAADVAARYSIGIPSAETRVIRGIASLHCGETGEPTSSLFEGACRRAAQLTESAPQSYLVHEAHGFALAGLALLHRPLDEDPAYEQFEKAIDAVDRGGARQRRRQLFRLLTADQPRSALPRLRALLDRR